MTASAAGAAVPSDRLYELLPAVYRMRDAAEGLPLRDLLRVIAEQVDVVERDIADLYENWFVETAADWAVPYLADLIGYTPLSPTAPAEDGHTARDLARTAMLVPRRDVAHTLRNRSRKGTLAILEELAGDVAGWPSAAVELYRLLGWTQSLNHQRPARARTVDLRNVEALDRLDGAFDELAHAVDVRRISSHRTPGWYNIREVGLFVWRLRSYPVTGTTANRAEQAGRHCFTFSVLGNDAPLFTNPDPEPSIDHLARETNVPAPIRRLAFQDPRRPMQGQAVRASAAYYGDGRSISIRAEGWPTRTSPQPVPASLIVPADLSGWRYRVPTGLVAVDPVLGRIMFPTRRPPADVEVTYHYGFSADIGGGEYDRPIPTRSLRALSEFTEADLLDVAAILTRLVTGAGTLEQDLVARWSDTDRALLDHWKASDPPVAVPRDLAAALLGELNLLLADDTLYSQDRFSTAPPELVAAALDSPEGGRLARVNRLLLEVAFDGTVATALWEGHASDETELLARLDEWRAAAPRRAVIQLDRSGVYGASIDVVLDRGQELTIRAANRTRPVIWLADREAGQPDSLSVTMREGSRVVLDGLLVAGRAVHFEADDDSGAATEHAHAPGDGGAPDAATTGESPGTPAPCVGVRRVTVRHCTFVPGWTIHHDCEPESPDEPSIELVGLDGAQVSVEYSIVGPLDVLPAEHAIDPVAIAIADSIVDATHVEGLAVRSTGGGFAHAVLSVVRTTVIGVVRVHAVELGENSIFFGVLTAARRQFGCVRFCWVEPGSRTPRRYHCQPDLVVDAAKANALGPTAQRETARVRPQLTVARYGRPAYCQLALTCADEIERGADDQSEMGVYHDLYQPQRVMNLQARLDEYTPAAIDAGVIFVT
jgi:hypothetical protein